MFPVSGRVENQSTQQLEEQLPRLQDEPDEMELREQEPPRHYAAKKKAFLPACSAAKSTMSMTSWNPMTRMRASRIQPR